MMTHGISEYTEWIMTDGTKCSSLLLTVLPVFGAVVLSPSGVHEIKLSAFSENQSTILK